MENIFKTIKEIKITNDSEPRIEFEITGENSGGVIVTKKYDVCLQLVPVQKLIDPENAEVVLENLLVDILGYAESKEK